MKWLALCSSALVLSTSIQQAKAQNQNTLTPIGNVGIHTIRPEKPLDVNGEAVFREITTVQDSLFSNGVVNNGTMRLNGLETVKNGYLLGLNDNNEIIRFPLSSSSAVLGDETFVEVPCPDPKLDVDRPLGFCKRSATRFHSLLSTGYNCPTRVGIGIEQPATDLDVRGNQFISSKLKIGGDLPDFTDPARLKIYSGGAGVGVSVVPDVNGHTDKVFEAVFNQGNRDATAFSAIIYNNDGTSYQSVKIQGDGSMHLKHDGTEDNIFLVESASSNEKIFAIGDDKTTYAREIKVTKVSNFPDYVFQEGYDLMPLSEVKEFVNEHHHLPNVPSEKEVLAEGQDLAKIQRATLEKLEELYLHVIELEEELKGLKAKGHED